MVGLGFATCPGQSIEVELKLEAELDGCHGGPSLLFLKLQQRHSPRRQSELRSVDFM